MAEEDQERHLAAQICEANVATKRVEDDEVAWQDVAEIERHERHATRHGRQPDAP